MSEPMDRIVIEVESNSTDAVNGLDNLRKSLKKLQKITQTASGLDENGINKVEGLANALGRLSEVGSGTNMAMTLRNLRKIAKLDFSNLSSATSAIHDVASIINPSGNTGQPTTGEQGDITLEDSFSDTRNVVEENNTSLSKTRSLLNSIGNWFKNNKSEKFLSGLKKGFLAISKGAREFLKSLKRIAMYRVIRSIISAITNGFKEGVNAVYQYSKALNGTFAKSMDSIATSMNYMKASLGAMSAPILNMLAPVIEYLTDRFVDFLNVINQVFARLSGANTWTRAIKVQTEYAEATDAATQANKKLKQSFLGIDEINALNDNSSNGGGASGGDASPYAFEEVPLDTAYVDDIIGKLKDILWYVGAIELGLLAWKIAAPFMSSLDAVSLALAAIGATLVIKSIKGVLDDGLDLKDIIEGTIGGALLGAGLGFKFGGWRGAIGGVFIGIGVTLVIEGITSMFKEGVTPKNVGTTIIGALSAVIGIVSIVKLFNKKVPTGVPELNTAAETLKKAGGGVSTLSRNTSTLTSKLSTLAKNLGLGLVIIAEVAAAAALIVGAIILLGIELDQVGKAWQPVLDNGETVAIAMGIGTGILVAVGVVTDLLGKAGTSLIVYMALGIAMLALLGVSAGLFLAEIWAIGVVLEQIGIAWQPVIDNGDTIATAIGIGTALLLAIGVVCALLGVAAVASCGMLPLAIALGTAMLLELGAAAVLFIAEVWVIGKALDELGQAWQPVLAQEDTISVAIEKGTELLIGIGVVTAALGVASVASVGLLPLAIALGTALLVELAAAFIEFCDSLIDVVLKLTDLAPPLSDLNAILPGLKTDMDSFTAFMGDFANAVVEFTKVSAIAGIAATIDTVIDFFTTDPVKRMYDEVTDQTEEFEDLIPALEKINPLIAKATELVGVYKSNMGSFESATGGSGGFLNSIVNGAKGVINGLISLFEGMANGVIKCINFLINGLNKISFDVPDWVPGIGGKKFGFNIATISEVSIPRLAEGGQVENGQLFIAREAGAELVGNIGGKTSVANNDQIIEGISNGVREANGDVVSAIVAMAQQIIQSVRDKDTAIYLDGDKVSKSVTSAQNRTNRMYGATLQKV